MVARYSERFSIGRKLAYLCHVLPTITLDESHQFAAIPMSSRGELVWADCINNRFAIGSQVQLHRSIGMPLPFFREGDV